MSVKIVAPSQQAMVVGPTASVDERDAIASSVNPRVRSFIADNQISTENIVKVEEERYYSCWDIMCGDTEPNSTDYIEITYKINGQVSVRLIEVEEYSIIYDIAEELRKHIPGYVPPSNSAFDDDADMD